MQRVVIGNWTRDSHLSAELLISMRELNRRFLDLAGATSLEWSNLGAADLALQVAPLTGSQRDAVADCPYALFDLRFEDTGYWRSRLESALPWSVRDDSHGDAASRFVHVALFWAWHVAVGADSAAHLLLGMHADTIDAFRRVAVTDLPAVAAREAGNLNARFSRCAGFWPSLIQAASRADGPALRRAQLSGLQLAVAARLPSS